MNKYNTTVCSRCVMDTTDRDIKFNDKNECDYCQILIEILKKFFRFLKFKKKNY